MGRKGRGFRPFVRFSASVWPSLCGALTLVTTCCPTYSGTSKGGYWGTEDVREVASSAFVHPFPHLSLASLGSLNIRTSISSSLFKIFSLCCCRPSEPGRGAERQARGPRTPSP